MDTKWKNMISISKIISENAFDNEFDTLVQYTAYRFLNDKVIINSFIRILDKWILYKNNA